LRVPLLLNLLSMRWPWVQLYVENCC
jgi:hypothetical protein